MNRPAPGTLAETLVANARYHGNAMAVQCNGRSLTHAALYERARRLAAAWAAAGLKPMDRVSVLAMNEIEYVELYAAAELSGIVLATLNFRLAVPELAFILKDSAPRHLVFESQYLPVVEQLRAQLPGIECYACIGGEAPWARDYEHYLYDSRLDASPAFEPTPPRVGDLAYLVYTSGTTGRPKGCMLGHRAMTSFAETLSGIMQSSPSDRTLLMMPMFHVGAKMIQLGAHWQGGSVVLHRSFDAGAILETIERERITVTHMAPTMIQLLLDHPDVHRHDLSSLRLLVYSAAAMPVALLRRGLDLLGPIFTQMYGQTEGAGTVLPASHHRPNGDERDRERFKSIGVPMRGTEVRIVDETGSACAPGAAGEIVIRGPMCMQGYWNNSAATLETLRDGWLHTGDVGRFDDDGFIYLVDRMKDVIVSGGENIYSREVEEALYEHPSVREVAVIGEPDATWGEAVCAVVALQPGTAGDDDRLTAHCRERIAGYKRPRRYVFVAELPKLPSGKIDKREVRRLHARSAG